jgi:type III restriction enzyme
MIELLPFQRRAVDQIVSKLSSGLERGQSSEIVLFQSPTGSGKTVVAGFVLAELASSPELDLAVIWLAPYSLHEQAGRSLGRVLGAGATLTEPAAVGVHALLERNEVVLLNWASISSQSRLLRSGSEQRLTLAEVCAATREAGRKILVVIDESHHTQATENAQALLAAIAPDAILEMSATPNILLAGARELIKVERTEVRDAGLIRECILINPDLDAQLSGQEDQTVEQALLDASLKTRARLAADYASEGIEINPLLLIQLPDGSAGAEIRGWVQPLLAARGIDIEGGRLAVWLSAERTVAPDDEKLLSNKGSIDVLIFKQAVATGWDCPRAQVLLKLRDPSRRAPFEIQTLGRIMRMPERRHYPNSAFNQGYVFHGHDSYQPAEDMAIATAKATLRETVVSPTLACEFMDRPFVRSLTPEEAAQLVALAAKRIGLDPAQTSEQNRAALAERKIQLFPTLKTSLLVDGEIGGEEDSYVQGTVVQLRGSKRATERLFMALVDGIGRSRETSEALTLEIYDQLDELLDLPNASDVQAFVVGNRDLIEQRLLEAMSSIAPIAKRAERKSASFDWELPAQQLYNTALGDDTLCEQLPATRYAYEPCYLSARRSQPERAFETWLEGEGAPIIDWWVKNGETAGRDLSLTFRHTDGSKHNFFPDYLIRFTDGTLGLYETKDLDEAFLDSEDVRRVNTRKLKALQDWVAQAPEGESRRAGFVCKRYGAAALTISELQAPTLADRGEPLSRTLLDRHDA